MGKPELKVYIDRDKAADLGVDVATRPAINLLISGETEVTKYKDETQGKRYVGFARSIPKNGGIRMT